MKRNWVIADKEWGYVHALFHKDMDALRAGLKEHIEEGFKYARYLDKQVGIIKSI